ncbi:putative Cofactor of BRCA1 isoform 1 protein [Naja naja]|nr:putative Cofactor of BRCA1 isoform 1 protein [Naja naja]
MFAGLQELGVANGEDLKETLTNCMEPLKAIEQFQTENGILLPSLQSALPFLDLHGTPRLEFHQSVFDELREKLLERVSAIASEGKAEERYKKLEDLLEKSFPLVKMPSIQPVVMCVMKHLPKIWQDNQALFGDEVSPLLKQYILEKENALFSNDLSVLQNFFSPSPKMRRQGEVVQKLTQMIGKNVKLYDMVLQFLRTLFLRTRNVHYCTLRAELLMSLHDLDISEICTVDPCHKFTWCLDACIREKFVDNKRARELQGFLDGVKKGQEQVLGRGLAFLTIYWGGPVVQQATGLTGMVLEKKRRVTGPKSNLCDVTVHILAIIGESPELLLLLRMLSLGQGAWDVIDSQIFKEPKLVDLITKFLPMLMAFVVDDYTFTVDQKLPSEEKGPASYPSAIPEAFPKGWEKVVPPPHPLLLKVTLSVSGHFVAETFNDLAFGDIFLHLLTGNLTLLADEFGQDDFCAILFDRFFLTACPRKDNVHRHLLRMLLHLHHKVVPAKLESLQKSLEPTKQSSEAVKELFNQLGEKLDVRKGSPGPEAEAPPPMDLPLPAVSSTPAPP